jgi:hypothetical protein
MIEPSCPLYTGIIWMGGEFEMRKNGEGDVRAENA